MPGEKEETHKRERDWTCNTSTCFLVVQTLTVRTTKISFVVLVVDTGLKEEKKTKRARRKAAKNIQRSQGSKVAKSTKN